MVLKAAIIVFFGFVALLVGGASLFFLLFLVGETSFGQWGLYLLPVAGFLIVGLCILVIRNVDRLP